MKVFILKTALSEFLKAWSSRSLSQININIICLSNNSNLKAHMASCFPQNITYLFWTTGASLPLYFHCAVACTTNNVSFHVRFYARNNRGLSPDTDTSASFSSFFRLPLRPQVKVWFQNRRTKFKRQKLEEEGSESQQKKKGSHHINRWRLATKQASPEEIDVTSDD